MTLITILLALGIGDIWKFVREAREFDWFAPYNARVRAWSCHYTWLDGPVGVLAAIVPAVFVVGLLQYLLGQEHGILGQVVMLVFSVTILLLCIGPKDMNVQLRKYLEAWDRGDPEGACMHLKEMSEVSLPEDARQMHRLVLETILIQINVRLLAVLFWFVVLGPVGAILYRAADRLRIGGAGHGKGGGNFLDAALRLQAILDWLPARITALGYAVTGSFVEAIHHWNTHSKRWEGDWTASSQDVLVATGFGALRLDKVLLNGQGEVDRTAAREQIVAAQALVKRTVVAWLTLLAVLTLAGWLA